VSDEFERIEQFRRRLQATSADVVLGIGDDAALLAPSDRAQALSVDAQVEGVHFDRALLSCADLGHRALASSVSDLAAMGARPRVALVALIAPAAIPEDELYAIADGLASAQHEYGCVVAGGNMAAGDRLSITTTVVGDAPPAPLTRGGAHPGDALFVTGALGAAALGLQLLRAGRGELAPACVERWRRLVARVREGAELAGTASAAIDVSDGLLQDLGHLAAASGLGFEVELPRLPLAAELEPACRLLGVDPNALALAGGEDYELLFTVPEGKTPRLGTRIGRAVAAPGLRLLDQHGRIVAPPASSGFSHFGAR